MNIEKNIFLVGFTTAGKSTIGSSLAKSRNIAHWDTDEMIEDKMRMPVSEIFRVHGEPFFREVETQILQDCSLIARAVISTGGGVFCSLRNINIIRKQGISVFLDIGFQDVLRRLKGRALSNRPKFMGISEDELRHMFESRREFYCQADFTFDVSGKSVQDIIDAFLKLGII
jgi:shikimate kinase